jgi:hypothetical protein
MQESRQNRLYGNKALHRKVTEFGDFLILKANAFRRMNGSASITRRSPMADDKDLALLVNILKVNGWQVKARPYRLDIDDIYLYIDLWVEKISLVLIDLKTYHKSTVEFAEEIVGTWIKYQTAFELLGEVKSPLFIAMRQESYQKLMEHRFTQELVKGISILVYNVETHEIEWIP